MLKNVLQEETKTTSWILCTAPGSFAAGFGGAKQNGFGVVGEEDKGPRMGYTCSHGCFQDIPSFAT